MFHFLKAISHALPRGFQKTLMLSPLPRTLVASTPKRMVLLPSEDFTSTTNFLAMTFQCVQQVTWMHRSGTATGDDADRMGIPALVPRAMSDCPFLCQSCSLELLLWALDTFAIPCKVIAWRLQNIWNVCPLPIATQLHDSHKTPKQDLGLRNTSLCFLTLKSRKQSPVKAIYLPCSIFWEEMHGW